MKSFLTALTVAAALIFCAATAWTQPVVPAKSGMVDYLEGKVFLDDKELPFPIVADFPYIKEQGVLRAEDGRAEALMNPGLFLRIGEKSAIRMVTNRFIDTRVELTAGSGVVDFTEATKDNDFTLVWKGATAEIVKAGTYHFDTDPARIKVFSGLARVKLGDQTLPIEVPAGKMVLLSDGKLSMLKFDKEDTDALDRWSMGRDRLVSAANASAARTCNSFSYIAQPAGPCMGNWRWNPWYGLYTYIPYLGEICNPWTGWCMYNPVGVWRVYSYPGAYPANNAGGARAIPAGGGVSAISPANRSAGIQSAAPGGMSRVESSNPGGGQAARIGGVAASSPVAASSGAASPAAGAAAGGRTAK